MIHKYPLDISGQSCSLMLGAGAKILRTELQYGAPMLWVTEDPRAHQKERVFIFYPTGAKESGEYIGTVFPGSLVFHLFEVTGVER